MALFYECTLMCARKLLDAADIVREAMLRQLSDDPARADRATTMMVVKCATLTEPWCVCFSARQSETKCRVMP